MHTLPSFVWDSILNRSNLRVPAFCLLVLGWQALGARDGVAEDKTTQETSDRKFEGLLSAALKAPEKADWKALRGAFAQTTHYHPYSIDLDEKLKAIAQAIGRGEIKESEAALLALRERDRFMRFDTNAMLMRLYQNTDQPEKVEACEKILDGLLGGLKYPRAGTSFDNPIHVLYIQEEYLVTHNMPVAGRGSVVHEGHHFDVFDIKADGDQPARKVYFNIDLPRAALSRSLETLK